MLEQSGNEKKNILQQLVRHVLTATPGKSIHEVISNLKTALGAYKNYAKEWDNLQGIAQKTNAAKPATPETEMLAPKAEQPPEMMPKNEITPTMPLQGAKPITPPPAPPTPPAFG